VRTHTQSCTASEVRTISPLDQLINFLITYSINLCTVCVTLNVGIKCEAVEVYVQVQHQDIPEDVRKTMKQLS